MVDSTRVYADLGICRVRDIRLTDAPSIARHVNDRRISINLRDRVPYPYRLEDAEQFLASVCAGAPRTVFAIEVDGEAVGCIGIELGDDIERITAKIGYWLGQPYWGRGIMPAAVRVATLHAIVTIGVCRVHAFVFARNTASARVLEKAGYVYEGRLRRCVIKEGEILDELLYAYVEESAVGVESAAPTPRP
jgi:ribosomal-protein-alanine N-acetyltransferase